MITGQQTVSTAGTAVPLATRVANSSILIKAFPTNTGIIYIGDSTVDSSTGFPLSASQSTVIEMAGNLAYIYIDASVNGDKVAFMLTDLI